MKTASSTLIDFLTAARASPDIQIAFADCYTFALTGGATLTYTNADVPVDYAGNRFLANGPLVSGLKYRAATGLNVDRQEITIAARPGDLTSGAAFLVALRDGAFDGAMVQRDRVFFSDFLGGTLVDGVTLFYGRVSTVDEVGRTKAKLTVANELVLLDIDMPRNIFAPTCLHTLFDLGCGLPAGAFSTNGVVGAVVDDEPHQFFRRARGASARQDRVQLRRQRGRGRDGQICRGGNVADADVSVAGAARGGRRDHRLSGLRPYDGHMRGDVRQSREFPRVSVRAAAADGDVRRLMQLQPWFASETFGANTIFNPSADATLATVAKLGLPPVESALVNPTRDRPASRASWLILRARATSPSAEVINSGLPSSQMSER